MSTVLEILADPIRRATIRGLWITRPPVAPFLASTLPSISTGSPQLIAGMEVETATDLVRYAVLTGRLAMPRETASHLRGLALVTTSGDFLAVVGLVEPIDPPLYPEGLEIELTVVGGVP